MSASKKDTVGCTDNKMEINKTAPAKSPKLTLKVSKRPHHDMTNGNDTNPSESATPPQKKRFKLNVSPPPGRTSERATTGPVTPESSASRTPFDKDPKDSGASSSSSDGAQSKQQQKKEKDINIAEPVSEAGPFSGSDGSGSQASSDSPSPRKKFILKLKNTRCTAANGENGDKESSNGVVNGASEVVNGTSDVPNGPHDVTNGTSEATNGVSNGEVNTNPDFHVETAGNTTNSTTEKANAPSDVTKDVDSINNKSDAATTKKATMNKKAAARSKKADATDETDTPTKMAEVTGKDAEINTKKTPNKKQSKSTTSPKTPEEKSTKTNKSPAKKTPKKARSPAKERTSPTGSSQSPHIQARQGRGVLEGLPPRPPQPVPVTFNVNAQIEQMHAFLSRIDKKHSTLRRHEDNPDIVDVAVSLLHGTLICMYQYWELGRIPSWQTETPGEAEPSIIDLVDDVITNRFVAPLGENAEVDFVTIDTRKEAKLVSQVKQKIAHHGLDEFNLLELQLEIQQDATLVAFRMRPKAWRENNVIFEYDTRATWLPEEVVRS